MQRDTLNLQQNALSNVYVIYGNDTTTRDKIYMLLTEHYLQPLTKKMATDWTGEGSPLSSRVIDVAFEHAQAVLVLLSGAELVRLRIELQKPKENAYEMSFSPQPTLDQIFEAGYAFGKYPERTILLQVDNVRPFSDIAGRDILTFTGKEEERNDLIDRLRSVGCTINNQSVTKSIIQEQEKLWERVKTNPRRVFVIHGRNKYLEKELFKFLNMLSLSPILWEEAINATKFRAPYTSEILDALLNEAQAVLVLLTGDDELIANNNVYAWEQGEETKGSIYQPRPNVVFETGMAFSNRRLAEKTLLVQAGNVKVWDAIDGRHRIQLSDKMDHRWELAISLQEAGCLVQRPSNELLRRIGNFGL